MDKSLSRCLTDRFNHLPEEKKKSLLAELDGINLESDGAELLNNEFEKAKSLQHVRRETACDFCRLLPCWFEKKHVDKDFCDRRRLFDTSKRIANARALALYERELRQFKRLLNSVSKDGTGGDLISVGGSLAAFKKALEDGQ